MTLFNTGTILVIGTPKLCLPRISTKCLHEFIFSVVGATRPFKLIVDSPNCADEGICYETS